MYRAGVRVCRAGSLAALVVLGVSLLALGLSEMTSAAPPKSGEKKTSKDAKDAKAKKETKDAPFVRWPDPLRLTLVAPGGKKADPQQLSQLTEMVATINKLSEAKWKENNVVPSRYTDEYEFIRRASLDIIGRIAKPEEIREYLRWPQDKRRSMLINRLLDSEEYARHYADLWANWLLTRAGIFGRGTYHDWMIGWLEEQFKQNRKYSEIVKDLITATGDNNDIKKGAATNFILANLGEAVPRGRKDDDGQFQMVPLTSRITRLFLGTQVQCAQCHDHPFHDGIKQEHFWGVNAFLRQVVRQGTPPQLGRNMMFNKLTLTDDQTIAKDAFTYYEKRNGNFLTAPARFLPTGEDQPGQRLPAGTKGWDRREKLADYVIEHPQFPRAIVNRMWGVFFGRGFVNPIDDFNDQNQPSNEELLNTLAERFKHYNYDLKLLIRWICNSNPYNLSSVANRSNDKPEHEALFARMIMKAMTPEQLFESIMVASKAEAAETKTGKDALRKKWLGTLISNFGDDEGNEVNFNGTVVQALLLMNGKDINDAISREKNGAVALAIRNRTEQAAIRELYLLALNRMPSQREINLILSQFVLRGRGAQVAVKDIKKPSARYEDLFWALLNSNEFLLNH